MTKPPTPSALERIAGSLPVEVVGTIIGALHGGAVAPLLPILAKSLASKRQQIRVESFLLEVSRALEAQRAQLESLSDAQFKLINEAVAAALQTTHEHKLDFLRCAISNAVLLQEVDDQEATVLARVLRDISAEEAGFVVQHFDKSFVQISSSSTDDAHVLAVSPGSRQAGVVGSLAALGVLTMGEPTYGQQLRFSPLTAKLIFLLRGDA